MKRCKNCGALIEEGRKYCDVCNAPVPEEKWYEVLFWFIIGFIVPLAGIVFYIMKKKYAPKTARAALAGFILAIALLLFWYIGIPLIGMIVNIG